MSLLYYESLFSGLNLHTAGGLASPHKVAMLLAVTDLIEDGILTDNRIEYSESLIAAFAGRFKGLRTVGDSPRPIYPYFHLRKDGFWHHSLKPGRSESYSQLSTVTSRNQIDRHIAFAYLDDELFELLNNHTVRQLLRVALSVRTKSSFHASSRINTTCTVCTIFVRGGAVCSGCPAGSTITCG